MGKDRSQLKRANTFLGGLLRDMRANTLAIMGMALIPLAGMVGGGVDISRMYLVKTRLQHACDAGALAGRRTMSGGTWSFNNYAARAAAEKFFDANYNKDAYGASGVTRVFSENAGKVSGIASAMLPMTLMRIFGRPTEKLEVVCDADMRLPNTDVMFVLDNTGSMGDDDGSGTRKIDGLKVAVKCFYEIVARLDTDANCTTGTPSGGTGSQVQIRFGFVPYSTNVNVGRLLKPEWFADTWQYQSREIVYDPNSSTWQQQGSPQLIKSENLSVSGVARSQCTTDNARFYGYNSSEDSYPDANTKVNLTKTVTKVSFSGNDSSGTCSGQRDWVQTNYKKVAGTTFQQWRYNQLWKNITGLKNGAGWNASFTLPIGSGGTNKTISWDGCIEERHTVKTDNYSPIPADANDLDYDAVPTSDANTKWAPALPGLIYTRKSTGGGTGSWDRSEALTTTDYSNSSSYYCPTAAKKLQTWASASDFDSYVDSLQPTGNTYHDIGLLWGARLSSPTGLFASEHDYTPQGGEIERHIIFMTDGDTNTAASDYNAYGVPWFDRRQTDSTSQADLDAQVDKRFAALCSKIKNATFNGQNTYTLWVISFGTVTTDTENRLKTCATSGRYYSAKNSTALQSTFKSIADQISQLRLTK
jgi:hypothetical protein